jgi:hypothetical protein
MGGNSQACSEMGGPIDTGAAQVVSEEMFHISAEMPQTELLVQADRSSRKSAIEEISEACSEMRKPADTGAAQVVSEEMSQMPVDMPQTDMFVTNPGNVQGGKIAEGPLQSPQCSRRHPQSPQSLSVEASAPHTHTDQRTVLLLPDPSSQFPGIALDHVPLDRARHAYSARGETTDDR